MRRTDTLDVAMGSHGRGTDFSIQDHYGNYRDSRANLRLYLVFRYLLFHSSDSGRIWYSRKAIYQENPTPYVTRGLEQNSLRTSDNTGIASPGHIDGYWHLPYGEFPIQSLDLERRQSSLSSKTFPQAFGMVLG